MKKYLSIFIVILAAAGGAAAFWYFRTHPKNPAPAAVSTTLATSAQDVIERSIPTPPPQLDIDLPTPAPKSNHNGDQVTALLLGYGGAGHQGGFLSDVIMVANFNRSTKKLSLIHIPRDLWVHIPIGSSTIDTKINAALALGTKTSNYPTKDLPQDTVLRGSYLSKIALKQVTGLDIDYVIGVDFSGFVNAIDAIQGITVSVPQTFDDPWYPVKGRELELCGKTPEEVTKLSTELSGFNLEKQFPCRYEQLHFDQGKTKMNGSTALKFVRSRHSATHGGDFARGERQSAVLLGIRDQLFTLRALDNIPKFFSLLIKSVKTDISLDTVKSLEPALRELPGFSVKQFGLSTTNVLNSGTSNSGAYVLLPKAGDNRWEEVQQYIQSQLKER